MIKACFIVKYPPIQGGVSRQSYWLAREMAERGNQIFVVTNANEVEDDYRIYLEDEDHEWYEPRFEDTGGFVKVRNTHTRGKNLFHVPYTNPYVTKLASIATQVIRRHGCQVIFSHYLQPYGLAAYLASKWTGVPYVVRHAGSDLGRLMNQRDLTTAYREVLKAADCVWTGMSEMNSFIAMGVREENIWQGRSNLLPQIFNMQAPPLDLNDHLIKLINAQTEHVQGVLTNRSPIDLSKPTIGIYGKVGEFKGSFDLLTALGSLKREGLDFNLIALTQGREFTIFRSAVAENDLQDRTWTLPFIPHWRVPGFIRACTAVCFLERDFPISFHGPGVPLEIMACGICLILSSEIVEKQRNLRKRLIDKDNILIVDDPKDHDELAEKLRFVIENCERAKDIGIKGGALLEHKVSFMEKPRPNIEMFERQLYSVIEKHKANGDGQGGAPMLSASRRKERLKSLLPYTNILLGRDWDHLVELFCHELIEPETSRFNDAVNFCLYIETRLGDLRNKSDHVENALRFEKNRNLLYSDFQQPIGVYPDGFSPLATPANGFAGHEKSERKLSPIRRINVHDLSRLTPLRVKSVRVETFDYDVDELLKHVARGEDLNAFPRERKFILFKKDLNFVGLTLELSEASVRLLDFCDGKHTVTDIVDEFAKERNGAQHLEHSGLLEGDIISALQNFSAKEIVLWFEEKQ